MNKFLAMIKAGVLIAVFAAGAAKAASAHISYVDKSPNMKSGSTDTKFGASAALLQVLFSFQGWENAAMVRASVLQKRMVQFA